MKKPEEINPGGQEHKRNNILGIIGLSTSFVLNAIFNALAANENKTIFNSSIGDISDKYQLDTTPAGWTFSIWGIIYSSIAANLVLYAFTIFACNNKGYVYMNPVIASPAYCAIYGINFLMNLTWIFLWDREFLLVALYVLWGVAATNIISMVLLIRNIEKAGNFLKHKNSKLYWTYIVLAFNGHGIYATWTVIASLLNFTTCLVYRGGVNMQTAVEVNLSMVLIFAIGWAAIELLSLDKYAKFLVTPYLVLIWALSGILSKKYPNPDVSDVTKEFLLGLILVSICLLLTKIGVLIFRQLKRPRNSPIILKL